MRVIDFDPDAVIPIVNVKVRGPAASYRARLVFDTGCGLTQLNTDVVEFIGYSAAQGEQVIRISGATGEAQQGYSISVAGLSLFGRRFRNVLVGAMDFEHLGRQRIDGLLGWDVIKKLRIELDGPRGRLVVYSKNEKTPLA